MGGEDPESAELGLLRGWNVCGTGNFGKKSRTTSSQCVLMSTLSRSEVLEKIDELFAGGSRESISLWAAEALAVPITDPLLEEVLEALVLIDALQFLAGQSVGYMYDFEELSALRVRLLE